VRSPHGRRVRFAIPQRHEALVGAKHVNGDIDERLQHAVEAEALE
jgi:hypothetical protein